MMVFSRIIKEINFVIFIIIRNVKYINYRIINNNNNNKIPKFSFLFFSITYEDRDLNSRPFNRKYRCFNPLNYAAGFIF